MSTYTRLRIWLEEPFALPSPWVYLLLAPIFKFGSKRSRNFSMGFRTRECDFIYVTIQKIWSVFFLYKISTHVLSTANQKTKSKTKATQKEHKSRTSVSLSELEIMKMRLSLSINEIVTEIMLKAFQGWQILIETKLERRPIVVLWS